MLENKHYITETGDHSIFTHAADGEVRVAIQHYRASDHTPNNSYACLSLWMMASEFRDLMRVANEALAAIDAEAQANFTPVVVSSKVGQPTLTAGPPESKPVEP